MRTPRREGTETPAITFDTNAEDHAVQREVYRRLSGRERLQIMFRLTDTVWRWRGFVRVIPSTTKTMSGALTDVF